MSFDHPLARRVASIAVLCVFAVLGAATSEPEGDDDPSSASASGETASGAGLRALEAHLDARNDHGEGPDGAAIAAAAREALAEGDAVAVRVVPGVPRKIVVLVRYRSEGGYENLRDIPSAQRNEELDRIIDAVDQGYEAGADELAVAIRGSVFYGAIAVRRPGQAVTYQTGSVISTEVLEPMLTATPGPEPTPTLEVGSAVEGQLQPFPMPQPTYGLTLAAPAQVRVRVTSDIDGDGTPIAIVCRGTVRAGACGEEVTLEPLEEVSAAIEEEQEREAMTAEQAGRSFDELTYDLPAGTYTVVVYRADCEAEGGCPSDRARYSLRLL